MSPRGKITLMLFFFSGCWMAALLTYYIQANREPAAYTELYDVVCRQLEALRASDFPRAYRQASMAVQQKLRWDDFIELVRSDYGGIVRANRVELGAARVSGDRAYVQVFFVDGNGDVHPCIYTLINEGGSWKIDGARMLPRWPSGVSLSGVRT